MNISSGATLDLFADPIYLDTLTGSGTVTNTFGNNGTGTSAPSGAAALHGTTLTSAWPTGLPPLTER